MKIVKIAGGLGNQMFQYAFLKAIAKNNNEPVAIDLSLYKPANTLNGINLVHNGYELKKIFGIDLPVASKREVNRLAITPDNLFKRAIKKFFPKKTHLMYYSLAFAPDYLKPQGKDLFYEGYWQSEKYFSDIKEQIKKDFTFPDSDQTNKAFLEQLGNNSLSIHVRRGDYKNQKVLSLLEKDYYDRALTYITQNQKITGIAVFSNDIEWCRQNLDFKGLPVFFATHNTGSDSYKDMALMSKCSHNIIANSSFSWWSAWLNSNPDKTVIAPKNWVNPEFDADYLKLLDDIVPENWIKL